MVEANGANILTVLTSEIFLIVHLSANKDLLLALLLVFSLRKIMQGLRSILAIFRFSIIVQISQFFL